MDLPRRLRSKQLKLHAPELTFAAQLQAVLNANFAFHREFLPWARNDWTLEQVRQSLLEARHNWAAAQGEKRYYLFLASGELVGCLGVRPDAQGKVGLGYWMAEAHARQGLMKEALETLLPVLQGSLLWLTTSPANVASQRLAEGLGLRRVAAAGGVNARLRYELRC
ncbi:MULTISPECIES: GNAT family N-acetyltransferase [Pseudomonas]|uniref:N-acetyltransferase domain-containing protein n=1 Tax=Pseudomonas fluorescens TaxID=294 RepID=A0A5E6PN63_PSEFL|nr:MULTISPECIES: GNAT family protein [Pseudomonas]VVM44439.1 hypothetical protein PS652_00443 [Pseudomonas fluorescens]